MAKVEKIAAGKITGLAFQIPANIFLPPLFSNLIKGKAFSKINKKASPETEKIRKGKFQLNDWIKSPARGTPTSKEVDQENSVTAMAQPLFS